MMRGWPDCVSQASDFQAVAAADCGESCCASHRGIRSFQLLRKTPVVCGYSKDASCSTTPCIESTGLRQGSARSARWVSA